MRIFANFLEAAKEIERDLWELGANVSTKSMQDKIGDFETKELIGYQFSVPTPILDDDHYDIPNEFVEFLGKDPNVFWDYVKQEMKDRWNGTPNPGNSWEVRRNEWEQYLSAGKFAYTYPQRIWDPTNQLGHCLSVLRHDSNSRQAIVQIYDKHTDFRNTGGTARIPCSLTYQFIGRKVFDKPELHCIYTMRSCDFYKHWGYDMILACCMNNYLAGALGWKPGRLIMQMGSLHAYKEDLETRRIF